MDKGSKEVDLLEEWPKSRLPVFLQATGYTVITMGIIIGGGYGLDQYFNTFPAIFIGSMVIAFPISQIIIFRKIKSFAGNKVTKKKS